MIRVAIVFLSYIASLSDSAYNKKPLSQNFLGQGLNQLLRYHPDSPVMTDALILRTHDAHFPDNG